MKNNVPKSDALMTTMTTSKFWFVGPYIWSESASNGGSVFLRVEFEDEVFDDLHVFNERAA